MQRAIRTRNCETIVARKLLCAMHVSVPQSLHLTHSHTHGRMRTQEGREKSILDKDKEAQALLEMASKPMHSAGLREPTEGSEGEDS